jgi:hypothetical protein
MRAYNLSRHLKTVVAIETLLFVGMAHAANWYVEPSTQGSGNGTSWSNAWSMSKLNASWSQVSPGDTVWLAGGTYNTALIVAKSGTAAAPITICRVTSANSVPVASPGWNSSFDSQVVINANLAGYTGGANGSQIDVPASSYIAINGNENSGSLSNNSRVYGILLISPTLGGDAMEWGENYQSGATVAVTNLTLINIDLLGPYRSESVPATSNTNGLNFAPYNSTRTNLLVHDCRIQGYSENIRENNFTGCVYEYNWIGNTANDGTAHEDVCLTYPGANETWRYNVITNSPNDGIIFDPGGYTNWYFYGNVYANSYNELINFNGASGTSPYSYYIYNNVFVSGDTNPDFNNTIGAWTQNTASGAPQASQIYNNIFWNTGNGLQANGGTAITNVVSDYNAYNYTSLLGWTIPTTESHKVVLSANPFVTPLDSVKTTQTGTLSTSNNVITGLSSTAGLQMGFTVMSPNLPYPTYIKAINSSTSITISTLATASGSATITFYGIGNYTLTSAGASVLANGLALASLYNLDPIGNTRGSPWYIGAYQYSSGAPLAPLAPTDLTIK